MNPGMRFLSVVWVSGAALIGPGRVVRRISRR
jgi:hypothetical protein